MNILMLTHEYPPYPGGVGRYCASLADAAARAGHHVTVLAPDHSQPDMPTADANVKVIRFAGDVFHFKQLPDLRSNINRALAQASQSFDVVHAADWPCIVAMRNVATPSHTQRLATLHGTDILLMKSSLRARLARASSALCSFDSYACNSRYTQSLLGRHYPKLVDRSVVTPLGVDASWFDVAAPSDQSALATRIKRQAGELMVLTVARLDSRKGQLSTIRALGRLGAARKQQVHYVCVGKEVEEGYGAKLQQAAQQLGIRLTLTGRLPDGELKAAYSLAHVFALTGESVPGRVEGFGLVLLEAAAQGLPSVVTQLQALPEVVTNGQTGWVCANNADLTSAFESALSQATDDTLKHQCIAHARQFTWDRCAALTYKPQAVKP
jgi:phosphatidylinositol alpha-1,6-mannosyltransferase